MERDTKQKQDTLKLSMVGDSHDERGLSELTRCQLNYDFLNYILDDLMPWHRSIYDLSPLEVNRYIQEGKVIFYIAYTA